MRNERVFSSGRRDILRMQEVGLGSVMDNLSNLQLGAALCTRVACNMQ